MNAAVAEIRDVVIAAGCIHEPGQFEEELFGVVEFEQSGLVGADGDEQVAVRVGVTVEADQRARGSPEDVVRGVIRAFDLRAENAVAVSGGALSEVGHAPGCPQVVHEEASAIAIEQQPASLVVPASAVQTIDNDKIVFVRTPEGFEKR